jgi:hypothetical protein
LAAKRERCGFKDEAATYLSPLIYFMCLYRWSPHTWRPYPRTPSDWEGPMQMDLNYSNPVRLTTGGRRRWILAAGHTHVKIMAMSHPCVVGLISVGKVWLIRCHALCWLVWEIPKMWLLAFMFFMLFSHQLTL